MGNGDVPGGSSARALGNLRPHACGRAGAHHCPPLESALTLATHAWKLVSIVCRSRTSTLSRSGSVRSCCTRAPICCTWRLRRRPWSVFLMSSTAEMTSAPAAPAAGGAAILLCGPSSFLLRPNWRRPSRLYTPFMRMSSSCVPRSTMRPFWTTMIWSESTMVERRWATTTDVRPTMRRSRASCTSFSFSESRADVASSSRRIFGSLSTARAIAIRCLWPPESMTPRSPTWALYESGMRMMKSWALAILAARCTLAIEAPSEPYMMFSSMDMANSTGSWETRPICIRSHCGS
mmetsp:Transcript_54754/g.114464  ORF Transcript_54754/g.114464 Transcript_54754/m.114464 type:complete len:292 (-) Transcript_54754:1442-2317(-)